MPRYFFHRTNGFVDNDEEGTELSNLGEARKEAVRFAGRYLADDPEVLWSEQEFRVEVTNEQREVILTVVTIAKEHQRKRP